MTNEQAIHASRQSVYGPWKSNMEGTSEQLTGLARQWTNCNPRAISLPSWWAPLTMVAIKLNRIASGRYHQDNFDDLRVYLSFVEEMQSHGGALCPSPVSPSSPELADHIIDLEDDADQGRPNVYPVDGKVMGPAVERIYIAGPYTAKNGINEAGHVYKAAEAAVEVMRRGHLAHCPHTATHQVDCIARGRGEPIGYERWMDLDLSIIEKWATSLLYLAPSPGADRELAHAKELGLKIYTHVEHVPRRS
jgi:hypothetical protein